MVPRDNPSSQHQQLRLMRNEDGAGSRRRATTVVQRAVDVLQDLQWEESLAAVKIAPEYEDLEEYREAIVDEVFTQTSFKTRWRYVSYFIKWFLPGLSLQEPVITAWRAFKDDAALQHVMRWQYVTSNPLVARFVDGPLASTGPGDEVDEVIDSYIVREQGGLNTRTRNRLRANIKKVGLLLEQNKRFYRIIPEVSPRGIAVLLAHLFAPEPQVVSWQTLVSDPWWRRLGIVDERMLREKLAETARMGLIARFMQMDTLDQVTTRYSLRQFQAGKVKAR
jgi:hypothetical protein